jgi:hypothetical protein
VSGDLVEGRSGNLMGVNFRNSLNHSSQLLQHFWIGLATIGVRILFLISQTNCNNFRPIWGDQGQFVSEPFLLSKQRQDYILKRPVELCNAIGLQADVDTTSEYDNLLDCSG